MMTYLFDRFQEFLARPGISEHTQQKYYYRLRHFVDRYGESQPEAITTDMIADYINAQTHLRDASKAILRSCFHAFLSFCELEPNPAAMLPHWRETPRRVIVPGEDEVKIVLAQAVAMCESGLPTKIRDGLIVCLAVVSGNRRGEIRNLKVKELEETLSIPADVYHVYTTGKTGECVLRFLPFHVPLIHTYLAIRPHVSEYVFVNLNPNHKNYGQQLSLVAFDRARLKTCQRAGVESITYQHLRRRLATLIARSQGVDVAAHALNHSPESGDRVIRSFYYDPDKEAVDQAVSAVFDF